MKNFIALFVIAFLVGLSNVSADNVNTTAVDDDTVTEKTVIASTDDDEDANSEDDDESTDDDEDVNSEDDDESTDDDEDVNSEDDDERDTSLKNAQKEFIKKFNELKIEYSDKMNNKESREEYLEKKNELFAKYKAKLAKATKEVRNEIKERGEIKRVEVKNKVKMKKGDIVKKIKTKRDELKAKYKKTYERKYGKMINRLDARKAQILINKIDALTEKVNTGSYSENTKEKFGAMLESLRELAQARLNNQNEPQLDIDSLFQ